MCIAIFSESGIGYPTKEIFKRCWNSNQDGAGYAYLTDKHEWHIKKGFMTFNAFWEAWKKEDFKEEHTVAMHFRLGTSGKMIGSGATGTCHPSCTHPFPVTDDEEKLSATEITYAKITMHNGVVGMGKGDLSDTMVAIKEHVDPLVPYISDKKILNLLTTLLEAEGFSHGSRWWVADGPSCYLLGDWIKDEETEIWYSKDTYRKVYKDVERDVHPAFRSSWAPRADFGREPDIIVDKSLLARNFLTKKLGLFSWSKWRKRRMSAPAVSSENNDNIVEVYNASNRCIALIDSKTGETIWEKDLNVKEDDIKQVDTSRHCIDCGAQVKRSQSAEGLCPYCYNQLWPMDGGFVDEKEVISCPECGETSYLIDSTFDTGDSECCRCGCLFWSTISGKDGIVGWNEDTKAERDRVIRSLGIGSAV